MITYPSLPRVLTKSSVRAAIRIIIAYTTNRCGDVSINSLSMVPARLRDPMLGTSSLKAGKLRSVLGLSLLVAALLAYILAGVLAILYLAANLPPIIQKAAACLPERLPNNSLRAESDQ